MIRQWLAVTVFAMSLAGCAAQGTPGSGPPPGASPEAFAHRVATSEVVLLWNCLEAGPGVLKVEGLAQNPWQAQPIQYLEFELVGVDAQGRTTAQASGAARNVHLMTNQSTPFQLELKTAGTEVRIDLYYHYRFEAEYDSARLAGPPTMSPLLAAQMQTFRVWDACGATQHRAR